MITEFRNHYRYTFLQAPYTKQNKIDNIFIGKEYGVERVKIVEESLEELIDTEDEENLELNQTDFSYRQYKQNILDFVFDEYSNGEWNWE